MSANMKFWFKVALVGGLGALVIFAITNRIHFIRKAIGA